MSTYITKEKISELLPLVCEIASQAGEKILSIYSTDFNVEYKDDESPLTMADKSAHEIIVEQLMKLAPDIPIISEEASTLPYSIRSLWKSYWLVDPLDGTKEFIKKNGEFTVNIALIEDGFPVMGVVYIPVSGELYFAGKNLGSCKKSAFQKGAYKEQAVTEDQKKISIRAIKKDQQIIAVGSRSHQNAETKKFMNKLGNCSQVAVGSSLKFCLVAEGKADVYPRLGPTSEWDTAAAQCIVEEAGGHVLAIDSSSGDLQRLKYNQKESFLNPYFLVYGDSSVDWKSFLV